MSSSAERFVCCSLSKESADCCHVLGEAAGRKAPEKGLAVALGTEADIKDGNDPAVQGGADESPDTLLELENGAGHLVFEEGTPALAGQLLHAGGNEWIVRHFEGKLIDEQAAQGFSGNIDALPEGTGSEEDGIDLFLEFG